MADFDDHANFAHSSVVATDNNTLDIEAGDGIQFPIPPFNAVIWQANHIATKDNSTIVRVISISGDRLTFTRAQEGSNDRDIQVFDQVAVGVTAKTITDIETKAAEAKVSGVHRQGLNPMHGDITLVPGTNISISQSGNNMTINAVSFQTVEKDLGSTPISSGSFTITGTNFVPGRPVLVQQAAGPYTGKGTLPDEAEMDSISATGYVLNSTTLRIYWGSNPRGNRVRDKFKFHYLVE